MNTDETQMTRSRSLKVRSPVLAAFIPQSELRIVPHYEKISSLHNRRASRAPAPCRASSYVMHILILVIMWSVIGMAWNLLSGYCGQVSFGHAAFFGTGAYSAGMIYSKFGISGWWGLPLSVFVVSAFALVIGYICLRLRGPFFALATLSMGVILQDRGGEPGLLHRRRSGHHDPGADAGSKRPGTTILFWPSHCGTFVL